MHRIGPLAVIVASVVALSSFVIAKKPEAKGLFEKIQPYQGFLGVFLLAWGIYDLLRYVLLGFEGSSMSLFSIFLEVDKLAAFTLLGYVASAILLGFLLGFGLIAKWIPGEGAAEKKGLEIQEKLLGYSLPIGLIGLISAILFLVQTRG
jgi:hypothetical protein